ncbi:MAG: hypothetical protein P1U87_11560 [Verrucomicrobiales bacterium]|nr:hypothetical protein [Verrucomicrobiales bacterium]
MPVFSVRETQAISEGTGALDQLIQEAAGNVHEGPPLKRPQKSADPFQDFIATEGKGTSEGQ